MPRRARRERDADAHHVVLRGHSGSPIITCRADALSLVVALDERFRQHEILVWEWAFLSNHLHIIPLGPIERISNALRDATGPYARRMNSSMDKRGGFFQDRFWSNPITDEDYASTCIVYVGRNSYTAGHVSSAEELEKHPFCGYGALLDDGVVPALPTDVDGALALFGSDRSSARRALRERMADSIAQYDHDLREPTLEGIIRLVAGERGVPPEILRSRSRHVWITEARVEVVRRAIGLGVPHTEIARALGVTRQAVDRVVKKLSGETVSRDSGWRALTT